MDVTRGRDGGGGQGLSPELGDLQAHLGHEKELEKGLEQLMQRLLMLLEEPKPGGIHEQGAGSGTCPCKSRNPKEFHNQS